MTEQMSDKIFELELKLKIAADALKKANEAYHQSDCDIVESKMQQPCSCFKKHVREALKKI